MNNFFSMILFIEAVISFYYVSRIMYKANRSQKSFRLFSCTAVGCGLWCLGYALMMMTEDDTQYLWARAVDVVGLVIFLVSAQIMICIMAGLYKKYARFYAFELVCGIIFLIVILNPNYIYLKHTENGIVPYFTSIYIDIYYNIYVVIVLLVLIHLVVNMLRKKNKRSVRVLGSYCMAIIALIIVGTALDTILPLMGVPYNLPMATSGGFCGLCIMYFAMHVLNRNEISFTNITSYIIKSFKSPVFVFDETNELRLFNEAASNIFSITKENRESIDVWKEIFKKEIPNDIADAKESIELDCKIEGKEIYYRLYIDPIFNDYNDFIGYIVLASDTTEVNKYLNKSEESRLEAISANHSKSMFLANMSHEIRTPMNSILSFSELALKEEMGPELREYFTDIRDSANSLLSIINDILNISKIESGKMELVINDYYPANIIKEVEVIIGMQAANKGLELRLDIDKNLPNMLKGDKDKIREVLINLLNNSIKYTKKGYVSLQIKCNKISVDEVEIDVSVKDSGIGIKQEELKYIFEKFKRVDEKLNSSTEGTGLGLSITKGFVELMGGEISINSIYGIGSIFSFTIKQQIVDGNPIEFEVDNKSSDNRQLKLKNVTVLAVDDNKINLKVDAKFLTRYGAVFDVVSSGTDAIEACRNKDYDFVLMDQMMPVMDGVTAMKEIRLQKGAYRLGGESKIIALTANVIEGVKEELIGEGFDDFLGKPIDFKEFERVVLRFLPEDRYYFEEEK